MDHATGKGLIGAVLGVAAGLGLASSSIPFTNSIPALSQSLASNPQALF